MGKLDMFWFPTGTGERCYLQFNIAGLRERTTGMNELFDRTSFAVARIRAGDARRREYFTAPARLRPRRQDPNALAIYLQWPGKKKMFGGRKPLTLRHCGYVPTALAEAFHACGLVRGTDPIFLVLDNLWYRDDDSSTYGAAVNLIVSADEWRSAPRRRDRGDRLGLRPRRRPSRPGRRGHLPANQRHPTQDPLPPRRRMTGGYGTGRVAIEQHTVGQVAVTRVSAVPALTPRLRFDLAWTLGPLVHSGESDIGESYRLIDFAGELLVGPEDLFVGQLVRDESRHVLRSLNYVGAQQGSVCARSHRTPSGTTRRVPSGGRLDHEDAAVAPHREGRCHCGCSGQRDRLHNNPRRVDSGVTRTHRRADRPVGDTLPPRVRGSLQAEPQGTSSRS